MECFIAQRRECFSYREFQQAFSDLREGKPLKGLIIDLRGNGGGLLDEAVNIVGMFVKKGESSALPAGPELIIIVAPSNKVASILSPLKNEYYVVSLNLFTT